MIWFATSNSSNLTASFFPLLRQACVLRAASLTPSHGYPSPLAGEGWVRGDPAPLPGLKVLLPHREQGPVPLLSIGVRYGFMEIDCA